MVLRGWRGAPHGPAAAELPDQHQLAQQCQELGAERRARVDRVNDGGGVADGEV